MNRLKLSYKIVLINIIIALIFGIIFTIGLGSGRISDFALSFGVVCLIAGLINLFVGFILLIANTKQWSQGFLLSSAALLLLSGISCGGGALFA